MMLIDAMLDWYFDQEEARKIGQWYNSIHVTELCQCRKKAEYFNKYWLHIFPNPAILVGIMLHKGVQQWLREEFSAEVEVEQEKKLGDIIISGSIDAIVNDWVVEIKHTQDVYESQPYEHHVLQVKLYLWLSGLEKGKLVYISPKKLLEFDVTDKPTDDEVLMLYDTWQSPKWHWECNHCPFNQICPKTVLKYKKR